MSLDAEYPFLVVVAFQDRDDAVAFLELAQGCGGKVELKNAPPPRRESPQRERRLGKIVLEYMPVGRSVDASDVGVHISQFGYAVASATSTLSKMLEEGDVVRLAPNIYQKIVKPA